MMPPNRPATQKRATGTSLQRKTHGNRRTSFEKKSSVPVSNPLSREGRCKCPNVSVGLAP